MNKNTRLKLFLVFTLVMLMAVIPGEIVDAQLFKPYIFIKQIYLPEDARIDYLRIFYYDDSSSYNQTAWITMYSTDHSFTDLTNVSSSGSPGYSTALSSYVGHVVNNRDNTYVLNWRPRLIGSDMRLLGMRVAYREDLGDGSYSGYYFINVDGMTFLPRDHNLDLLLDWSPGIYGGDGSIYLLAADPEDDPSEPGSSEYNSILNYLPFIHE